MINKPITSESNLYRTISSSCYITSSDKLIVDRLIDIIETGIIKLSEMLNLPENFDFEPSSRERELLISYCFNSWNNKSSEDFQERYHGDLMSLRLKNIVLESKDNESV